MREIRAIAASLLAIIVITSCMCSEAGSEPLKLNVHYVDSSPQELSGGEIPKIVLSAEHAQMSLEIKNISDENLVLWQFNTPAGDAAVRFEFKMTPSSKNIFVAKVSQIYTGGMGIPKTFHLTPHDSFKFNVNFLSYWNFPFNYEFKRKIVYIRAVYASKSLAEIYAPKTRSEMSRFAVEAKNVWLGTVRTQWQKVEIINDTNHKNPLTGTCCTPNAPPSESESPLLLEPAPPASPSKANEP